MTRRPSPWTREEPTSLEFLVTRARAGHAESFGHLALRLRNFVEGIVARFEPRSSEREDLVQETFVRSWRALPSLESAEAARVWIARIAARLALEDARRRRRRRTEQSPDLDQREARSAPPQRETLRREARVLLDDALRQVPARRRLAFHLRVVEGLSHGEIARILDTTVPTTRVYVCKARAQLARLLEPHRDLLRAMEAHS